MPEWQRSIDLAKPRERLRGNKSVRPLVAMIAGVILSLAVIILLIAYGIAMHREELERSGVAVGGVIEQLDEFRDKVGAATYRAYFSFDAATGHGALQRQQGSSSIRLRDYTALHPGSTVQVLYEPARPSMSELQITKQNMPEPWADFKSAVRWVELVLGSTLLLAAVLFGITFLKAR